MHLARHARDYGIDVRGPVRPDDRAFFDRIETVIDTIRGGDGDRNVRALGIALFKEHGRLLSPHEVLAGDKRLSAERIVIATGASQRVPPIDGIAETGYITNEDAVALDAFPESLVIIGGGIVATEFAQIFARLGVEVTVIASRPHLLPKEDPALTTELETLLEGEGIRIERNARAVAVRREDGEKVVTFEMPGGETDEARAAEIMVATGRDPNVENLGLDDAGVSYSEHGVSVDTTMRTNVPSIWAAGDITGVYPFTHVADYQARILAHNLFTEGPLQKADYRVVPWVTFTNPELARVGLTETEARAGGYDVVVGDVPFADQDRAIVTNQRAGRVKLVVDRATRHILGGQILGAHAGELIVPIALAMRAGLPIDAIRDTIHPYPTMSEAVWWAAEQLGTEKLDPQ
jgi:pyruvate/2-oxoglutarate dehydrogenase complex dihydrolipoamide dehydrogenase (E3) component